MARHEASTRPSPRHGWRRATRLWRLVLVGWAVSWIAFAPALLVIRLGVFPALSALPEEPGVLPAGDVGLIIVEAARPIFRPFGLAVLSGLFVLWWWSVLWHAGVVAWELWTGARRVRLGEVLGLGMVAWWRYARLSATGVAAFAIVGSALWLPLWSGVRGAFHAMAEERMMALILIGVVATKLTAIVVWIATLHGAWLLGLPERRSAVLAWLVGLGRAARRPFSSVATWLVWLVPAWVAAMAPLWLGLRLPGLRGTVVLIAFGLLAALVRSFCWVGMFASFAPVTGLVGDDDEAEADKEVEDEGRRLKIEDSPAPS
jgi:hypothetical protein